MHWFHELKFFLAAGIFAAAGAMSAADAPDKKTSPSVTVSLPYVRQPGRASNQFAVWVEDAKGNFIRTLYVTNYTGQGGFRIRKDCLPTWVRRSGAATAAFTRREVYYHDLVKGELAKPLDGMKDQVIVRSDGSPVFHLANVLDDIAQGVTHIIRGDDHVENTYRHLLLFEVFHAIPPQYAHLPMIVNAAGKPYSKRDGDAFVGDFRSRGFLAPALFNYLALLGWSPGDDREKLTLEEMVAAFQLDRVKSAPAQFDIRKLSNLNGLYIAEMPTDAFTALAREYAPEFAAQPAFDAVAALMQNRTKVMDQVRDWRYFFADDFSRDEKNSRKQLTRPEIRAALAAFAEKLAGLSDWTEAAVMRLLEQTEAAAGLEHGKLFQPVRLAATGVAGGAELDRTLCLIGRDAVVRRMEAALALYQGVE